MLYWTQPSQYLLPEPIVIIDNGRQVALVAQQPELRDIGEPFLVGLIGMEVTLYLIAWMGADLTFVRAVGALLLFVYDRKPLLTHQSPDRLLRDDHRSFVVITVPKGMPDTLGAESKIARMRLRASRCLSGRSLAFLA